MKAETCSHCKKGKYQHGTGLYDYYSCGHAYEKPLKSSEKGQWVLYKSPYLKGVS